MLVVAVPSYTPSSPELLAHAFDPSTPTADAVCGHPGDELIVMPSIRWYVINRQLCCMHCALLTSALALPDWEA